MLLSEEMYLSIALACHCASEDFFFHFYIMEIIIFSPVMKILFSLAISRVGLD